MPMNTRPLSRLNRKQPADYQVTASHTHYFRGDYSLHVRPQYNFDVRLASTRTKKCEYGNKENLKTYFMSDGCTNITQTGDEYFNIFRMELVPYSVQLLLSWKKYQWTRKHGVC